MDNKRIIRQGDILLLLVHQSGKQAKEVAEKLEIHPNHLSRLYNSEKLTQKIKTRASMYFEVPETVFDDPDFAAKSNKNYPLLSEIKPVNEVRKVEEMSAIEVMRYLEEKDKRHYEERSRLLAIIENLTKK